MFRGAAHLGYSTCPLKKENLVRINIPNTGAEGMSLLDRSLRRVEEAGTDKDSTEMGLPKNLPGMPETKVPATDHFHLKYSTLCSQPKCPHLPGLQQMLPGKKEKNGIMAQGCQDRI